MNKYINFGKYKGIRLDKVPISYIDWFLERKDSRGYAKVKKNWRRRFGAERARRLTN